MTTTETSATLYDADTGDHLGPATDEQVAASDSAGVEGIFLIGADGTPCPDGSWDAQQPGWCRVFTR